MDANASSLVRASVVAAALGLVSVLTVLTVVTLPGVAGAEEGMPQPAEVDLESAEMQAAVLAAEDRRLTEIRTVTSLARWQGQNWQTPYRLGTASGYTLVLTPRSTPYTVDDLLELAPQTFLKLSDGSYLLTENIIVMARASLHLSAPGGLVLRMASSHQGFATIVSFGGELAVLGEAGAEARVTSWDLDAAEVDTQETDGRAYIRAIGGQFEARDVVLEHLGFWSGRTGGIALTGTDRPNTGAIETGGSGPTPEDGTLLDGMTQQAAGELPAGGSSPILPYSVPAVDFVSARISGLTSSANAFGLFVSGANGIEVTQSSFVDNLLGGVVLHRYVTNGQISTTTSSRNVGDGFTVDRASTGISFTDCTATENTGSGFRLAGRPLAEGPSAVGASLRSYGNNSVTGSTSTGNGRYGIEILGGRNVSVLNSVVEDHDMGIMVNGPAERMSIIGNTVRSTDRHGVALINGVAGSTVTGNVVDGSSTGVYVRDSTAQVTGNTVTGARSHGVSFIGSVDDSEVAHNVLAGSGPSALDRHRAGGDISSSANNVSGWQDTTPWYHVFKKLLQPLNALWAMLALIVLVTAVRGRRTRGEVGHPYAHQMAHHGFLEVPAPGLIDLRSADQRETVSG